ncbi:MAG: hypothetical protein Q8M24_18405 [Pseudolabrys sp.]|nr:hypothetical protein [Pseudolabrys sp.]MDP2297419.1 hypothetical protein [Pseudolabrys sp.]
MKTGLLSCPLMRLSRPDYEKYVFLQTRNFSGAAIFAVRHGADQTVRQFESKLVAPRKRPFGMAANGGNRAGLCAFFKA